MFEHVQLCNIHFYYYQVETGRIPLSTLFTVSGSSGHQFETGCVNGRHLKMSLRNIICLVLVSRIMSGITEANTDVKYLYFTGMDATHWQDAKDNCGKMNGRLAKDVFVNDWELRADNVQTFLHNFYWIGLKSVDGEWIWDDGTPVNMNDTQAWPLKPEFAANITWGCALWNPIEPFYIPSDCSNIQAYVCEISAETTCSFQPKPHMEINETNWTRLVANDDADLATKLNMMTNTSLIYVMKTGAGVSLTSCEELCEGYRGNVTGLNMNLECWIAEYRLSGGIPSCELLLTDGQPVMVNLQQVSSNVTAMSRHCFDLTAVLNDTCDCRCINVTSPTSIVEVKEEIEKMKKALTVETKNLSASVRKKTSAIDERPSSTSMGYLGIAAIAIVLGGLILADVSAMFQDVKLMVSNIKSAFG